MKIDNCKFIPMKQKRIIAHLDMDSFFASVEERDNPRIKGKPIVVGADPLEGKGRGVVSTANYKAREYGIRSALPISKAWQFSEMARRQGEDPAVFLDVDMQKYAQVSRKVMEIIENHSDLVEKASVDEAYFDLSSLGSFEKAKKVCAKIKKEIKDKQKLTASIGLGPNKLIAKIASDMQKPDGLTMVKKEEAEKFLKPLSIRKIPGIGPKSEEKFNSQGVKIVEDLKKYSKDDLRQMMGKWGVELYEKSRGRDSTPVSKDQERKSIGEQETFVEDSLDFKYVFSHMEKMSKDVMARLKNSDFEKFKTVVITVRFSDFQTLTRSHTFKKSSDSQDVLRVEMMRLLMPFFDNRSNPKHKKIRLVGVRIEKLS